MAEANCDLLDNDIPNFDMTFADDDLNFLLTDEQLVDYVTDLEATETTETDKTTNQLDDGDVTKFIEANRNKNTTKKTRSDLNVFYRWAQSINETRTLDKIPPSELDNIIAHFVLKVRKQDDSEFEPDTLTSYIRSFDRFLRENGQMYSILQDKQFAKAREALASKRKQLRRIGRGQKPNKAAGLTDEEIQHLWEENQLGICSPPTLLRTVWLNNTMYFGWRARDEHRRARFGDFQIKQHGPKQMKYIEWVTERGSKTRTGENEFVPDRPFNPKMFATGGPKCPVFIFEEYVRRRPVDMNYPDAPFYLASIPKPATSTWYKKQPLGANSLGSLMKQMTQAAGLDGRFTNHSARRTMISTLRRENVEPLNIIGLAGQRNLKSLDSYSEASGQQQKDMSDKISNLHTAGESSVSAIQERSPLQSLQAVATNPHPMPEQSHPMQGMFSSATFNNCTFSFGGSASSASSSVSCEAKFPVKRFKRVIPFSDSDDEL